MTESVREFTESRSSCGGRILGPLGVDAHRLVGTSRNPVGVRLFLAQCESDVF